MSWSLVLTEDLYTVLSERHYVLQTFDALI